MGIATHARSPVAHREEETPSSDEALTQSHLVGQSDIRSFCSSSVPSKVRRVATLKDVKGDAEDVPSAEPLIKLAGQMDIRNFMQSDAAVADAHSEPMEMDKASCAFDADEEAALAMGLSVGMLSYDMEEFLEVDDLDWSDLYRKEMALESAEFSTQEESAREMGLSLIYDDEVLGDCSEDWQEPGEPEIYDDEEDAAVSMGLPLGMEELKEEEAWYPLEETDPYEADEEAAVAMGLSLGLDEVDPYKADEEAARAMGLSLGIAAANAEEDYVEELDRLDAALVAEAEFEVAVTASLFEAEEESARSLGLSLSIGDEVKALAHVDKKPRLTKVCQSSPATPPKKVLMAKTSDEVSPLLQAAKRRRVGEDSKQDSACEPASKVSQLTERSVPEVHAR